MHYWSARQPLSTAARHNDRSRSQTDLNTQSDDEHGGVETGSLAEEEGPGNIHVTAEHVDEVAESGEAGAISGTIPLSTGRPGNSENPTPFYDTVTAGRRFGDTIQDASIEARQPQFIYGVGVDQGSGPGGGGRRFEPQHTDANNLQEPTAYGTVLYPGNTSGMHGLASRTTATVNPNRPFNQASFLSRGFDTTIPQVGHLRNSPPSFSALQRQHSEGAPARASSVAARAGSAAALYGSSVGTQSLHQQRQQQQLQLSGVPQVGADVPDAVDPISWRTHGSGSQSPTSPNSVSSGDRSDKKKRKSDSDETPAKPYACRFCSQSFDKSQALGGHMNRHRQEREKEQLDNAHKLVFKQQGLQGLPGAFTGLPMQNLNTLAKFQGTPPLLFDQATLRYNQALQYQSASAYGPRPSYGTLHPGSLQNSGSWNLGNYLVGNASATPTSQIEASATTNLSRMVQATPDDLYSAAGFSNMGPSSYNLGRTNPALETGVSDLAGLGINPYDQRTLNLNAGQGVQLMCSAEQYGMGSHTSAVNEGQEQSAAALECDNMGNLQHSPPGGGMIQGTLSTSPSAGSATSGEMYEQTMAGTPSPPLGRSSDPRDNHSQQDMVYGYSGVSTLTQTEVSTSGSERSAPQQPFNFSGPTHSFPGVPQGPPTLGGMHPYQEGAPHGSQLPASSTPPEQLQPDSAPTGQNSPGASTERLDSDLWMLGERKPGLLVAEPGEVLSPTVINSLTPRAGGPAERLSGERSFPVLRDSATELDTSGFMKVDESNAVVDYASEPEAEINTSYANTQTTSEQCWRIK